MASMISVWRGWELGVLLCEMGCASLGQAATGRDSHFPAPHRPGVLSEREPCLLTVEVWTPGQRSSRWQDGSAWVWKGELVVRVLPGWQDMQVMCACPSNLDTTRFEVPWGFGRDLRAVVWGGGACLAQAVLLVTPPPPCLVPSLSCFLLAPLPALPAHLGRVWQPRSGCELISSSLGVAVGPEGAVTPFFLALWLTPSRCSTPSLHPGLLGHPLALVHGHSRQGPPRASVPSVSSVSPSPVGLRMWGAHSTTRHHRAQSRGWVEAVPAGTPLPLCSAWSGAGLCGPRGGLHLEAMPLGKL